MELCRISDYILGVSKNIRAQKLDSRLKEKMVIMVSGLSGAGKDSIVDELKKHNNNLVRVKTLTTRPPRPEEAKENDPYERVTIGQFEDYLRKGQILESTEYAGSFYGTQKEVIQEVLLSNQVPVLRVDPKGADFYLKKWREGNSLFNNATLIYFFVIPPSIEVLRERLLTRSKDPNFVEKRLGQSQDDLTHISEAEYIVINESGKLHEVVKQISSLI